MWWAGLSSFRKTQTSVILFQKKEASLLFSLPSQPDERREKNAQFGFVNSYD
jgi:hypothetical protein